MKKIGEILVEEKIITQDQLEEALAIKKPDETIGEVLTTINYATESDIINALAIQTGIEKVLLFQFPIDNNIVKMLPEKFERENLVVPLSLNNNILRVAVNDPLDMFLLEDIKVMTGYKTEIALSTKTEIEATITKVYNLEESLESLNQGLSIVKDNPDSFVDQNNPVVKLVNQIIVDAVMETASDIHISPEENDFIIKYRVDGDLITKEILPKKLFSQIVTRIKVMSKLDITEERMPQDGRIKTSIEGVSIDLRISTLPTVHGENIVIRILDLSTSLGGFENLGLLKEDYEKLLRAIQKPNGIVLISGPTGSGKSTTLYACLNSLNQEKVNIVTVEDPVEMQLKGLKQVQINPDLELTFSVVLRNVLRQDPDIIMVGEIRDADTAEISIRAALTGHLVLSTIHTNSSLKSLTRLTDLGIDDYLISDSLNAVIAQRLVKRLCPKCSISEKPNEKEKMIMEELGMKADKVKRPVGCSECGGVGFKGRIPLFEILEITDEIRFAIARGASMEEIMELAKKNDFKTLAQDGVNKLNQELTTLEEVIKVVR